MSDIDGRLLDCILTNNVRGLKALLRQVLRRFSPRGLGVLLTRRRRMWPASDAPVNPELHPVLRQGLTELLLDRLPLLGLSLSPRPGETRLLATLVQAYRGLPIHLAVALSRDEVVKVLLDVAMLTPHRQPTVISRQLTTLDSSHDTPLSLAVRVSHWSTFIVVMDAVRDCLGPRINLGPVVRHCMALNSPRLIFRSDRFRLALDNNDDDDDDDERVVKVTYEPLEEVLNFYDWRLGSGLEIEHVSLYASIFHLLDTHVSCTLDLGDEFFCRLLEPSPFHFATTVLCSSSPLGKDEGGEDLQHHPTYMLDVIAEHASRRHWTGPGDVSTVRIAGTAQFNGTAAHFALLNYQPRHLQLMHPGYDFPGKPSEDISAQGPQAQDPQNDACFAADPPPGRPDPDDSVQNILRVLEYLQQEHGVHLFKVNLDRKTPLDLLPPDSDPFLTYGLSTLLDPWVDAA